MNTSKVDVKGVYMAVCNFSIGAAMSLGPLAGGAILESLPGALQLFDRRFLTKRLFFAVLTVLMLCLVPLVKILRLEGERGIREIIKVVAVPLQRKGKWRG